MNAKKKRKIAYFDPSPNLKDTCQRYIVSLNKEEKLDAEIISKKRGMSLAKYTRESISLQNKKYRQLLINLPR